VIIKLRDGFHSSDKEPIAFIITDEEKKAINNMGKDNYMIAFYPTNGGFTPELISQWMQEGINFQQAAPTAQANNKIIDAEFTIAETPKHD